MILKLGLVKTDPLLKFYSSLQLSVVPGGLSITGQRNCQGNG